MAEDLAGPCVRAPAQPCGFRVRSRFLRLRLRIRDHPPTTSENRVWVVTYHGSTGDEGRAGARMHNSKCNQSKDRRELHEQDQPGTGRNSLKGALSENERTVRQRRTQQIQGGQRRSDYGSFKVSERDKDVLALLGEQYALTLPQLARLIDRRLDTARALRDRWKRAGWIDSRPLAVDAPSFVWLTGRGRTLALSPYRVWDANPGLALHISAVTDVRLLLEHELRLGEWECERSIARRLAQNRGRRRHLPDGILSVDDGEVAIEVELHLKSRVRLQAIVDELSAAYEQVWYFAPDRFAETLLEIAAAAPVGNVSVYRYPPDAAEIAAAAWL